MALVTLRVNKKQIDGVRLSSECAEETFFSTADLAHNPPSILNRHIVIKIVHTGVSTHAYSKEVYAAAASRCVLGWRSLVK